jgi:hypothetical protein
VISYWTGDDTAADAKGINNATLNGGAGYAPGVVRDAFQFNGVDGYFQSPTHDLPTGNSDRTIDLWVKIDAFSPIEAFFAGYGRFGANNQTYQLGANSADQRVFFSQWGQAVFGPSLATGTWYNVAVTNVGNSVTLFLDGQAVATGNLTISTPAATQFYMGRIPGGLGDDRRLDGEVDEVRVFGGALNPNEIQAIYYSDLNQGQGAGSAASELSAPALATILSTDVALTSRKVGNPDSLTLPGPVTSSLTVGPATTPTPDAATSSVSAALVGGAATADAVSGELAGPVVSEPFAAIGPASL